MRAYHYDDCVGALLDQLGDDPLEDGHVAVGQLQAGFSFLPHTGQTHHSWHHLA